MRRRGSADRPLAAAELRLLGRLLGAGVVLLAAARLVVVLLCLDRLGGFTAVEIVAAVTVGTALDVSFLTWLLLPVWALVFLPGAHWAERPRVRAALVGWVGLATFLLLVGVASDLAHFREFDVRLNGASVDYLRQPVHLLSVLYHEFGLLPAVVALGLATWGTARRTGRVLRDLARRAVSGPRRALAGIGTLTVLLGVGAGAPGAAVAGLDVVAPGHAPHAYLTDQIARNGASEFVEACLTELRDESLLERRFVPAVEGSDEADAAAAVVRREVSAAGVVFDPAAPSPLARTVATGADVRRRNIVIVLMESFSARGIASLGGEHDDAPRFDRLAREGLLFTNVHAVGTRTNRGIAGVLSSMPALPGLSPVCALPPDGEMWTIATELRSRGYRTVALYGGDREYDNLDAYARAGGFERFVARDDFDSPSFETEWGVCDEDLFDRTLLELDVLARGAAPFLGFVLTLSNHRPYRVPDGRVEALADDDPERPQRMAFRYADDALGRFMDAARARDWYDDTIFVLVADHGRHPRAVVTPDVASFRVPLLVVAPGLVEPGRDERVASQVDVAPTVLGLLGGTYRTCGFGSDLLRERGPGRAMLCIGDYVAWLTPASVLVWAPGGAPVPFAREPVPGDGLAEAADVRDAEVRLRATARLAYVVSRGARHRLHGPAPMASEAR